MKRQSGEAENVKKEPKMTAETRFDEWPLWKKALEETDIEPADFFDPEEFGYRRKQNLSGE
jgi:hypothetical protein